MDGNSSGDHRGSVEHIEDPQEPSEAGSIHQGDPLSQIRLPTHSQSALNSGSGPAERSRQRQILKRNKDAKGSENSTEIYSLFF